MRLSSIPNPKADPAAPASSNPATAGVPRARRLRSLLAGAVLTAFIAGLLYLFWPSSLGGCSTMTIVSGNSMEPTYSTGDLVWSRCGEPAVGDVVVYSPPDMDGAQVIHRIVGGDGAEGWVLQGDNNDFLDPWNPTNEDVAGIAAVHIPGMGNVVYSLGNPFIWGSLLLLAAAIYLWPRAQDTEANDSTSSVTPVNSAEAAGIDPGTEPAPGEAPELVH